MVAPACADNPCPPFRLGVTAQSTYQDRGSKGWIAFFARGDSIQSDRVNIQRDDQGLFGICTRLPEPSTCMVPMAAVARTIGECQIDHDPVVTRRWDQSQSR